jgi:hypothetical protein
MVVSREKVFISESQPSLFLRKQGLGGRGCIDDVQLLPKEVDTDIIVVKCAKIIYCRMETSIINHQPKKVEKIYGNHL